MDKIVIGLMDCNHFYASCERLIDPTLEGRPVAVLSNNDGCAISVSAEAKAFGVKLGVPIQDLKPLQKRHGLIIRSPNFRYYFETSQKIIKLVEEFSTQVEMYSIDESFFEIQNLAPGARKEYGQALRRLIWHEMHIPVSVGIAETKTLAKIATVLAKRVAKLEGVLVLAESPYRRAALERTPLQDVWGVGGRLAKRLQAEGLVTALDLAGRDPARVRDRYGVVLARTVSELQGTCCLPVDPGVNFMTPKSVMFSRSFGTLVRDEATMRQAVATYTRKVAEKLRLNSTPMAARELTVFIQTNKHRPEPQYRNAHTVQLPAPSQMTAELTQHAFRALAPIYRDGYAYYKAGVICTELVPAEALQLGIFDTLQAQRNRRTPLMATMDTLNYKMGPKTVFFGAEGLKSDAWRMRRGFAAENAPEESDFFTARESRMPLRFF